MYAIRSYYERRAAEELPDPLTHQRHPGGATDHDHFQHLAGIHPRILEGAATGQQGPLHQRLDERLELGAAERALPAAKLELHLLGGSEPLLGLAGEIQQLALFMRPERRGIATLRQYPIRQQVIKIIAAEGSYNFV